MPGACHRKPGDDHLTEGAPLQPGTLADRGGTAGRGNPHIPVTDEGLLDLETYTKLLGSGRLNSSPSPMCRTSWGRSTVVESPGRRYKRIDLIDAAQSAPHVPPMSGAGVDFAAIRAQNAGPTGIGVLYGSVRS
jgi:hypothetical protein